MRKKRQIKITLRSDLCAGSGYSFAGMIDSDVCYDDCGLPFIPARRLKGCMREAALTTLHAVLSDDDIDYIFGKRGQKEADGIYVSDARLGNYEALHSELKKSMTDDGMKEIVTPQKALDTYTTVKAQTKIDRDSGVAEDLSLRFTRTVNQVNALTKEEVVFFADLIYKSRHEKNLELILQATRSIGLHRNRGLGAVKMEWSGESGELFGPEEKVITESGKPAGISYKIKNLEPLMLSSNERDSSASYISGQSIIGMMAARYLEKYGQADAAFQDLFLNGTVKFTNATISEGDCIFYPAPAYLAKLKLHKHIVNTYVSKDKLPEDIENRTEYRPEEGNQPKKLKGKYVYMDSERACALKDVKRILTYHNRINDADEPGNHLYSHEALAAGQTFSGEIFLPEKYLELVKKLLSEQYAWFGKSKTAQYGMCEIMDVRDLTEPERAFCAKKGDTVLVTLLSDGIFIKEDADYTVYEDELLPIIASGLFGKGKVSENEKPLVPSMITVKEIHGYQSMWNLRRQPVPAVCAGSVFAFRLEEDVKVSCRFIGERNMEGYGQIRIANLNEMEYYPLMKAELKTEKSENEICQSKELIQAILQDELYQEAKKIFMEEIRSVNLKSPALLGRVTLMLKESCEKQKNDEKEAFMDFSKRILSIKTKSEREKLCSEVLDKFGIDNSDKEDETPGYHMELKKMKKYLDERGKCYALLRDRLHVSEDDILESLQKRWADMLMAALTEMKYMLKSREAAAGKEGKRDEED